MNEKEILIKIIGLLYALKNKAITIEESEQYLFCPRVINELKKKKINQDVIEILEYCCEIEDIYSLTPQKYNEKLNEFIEMSINKLKMLNSL